MIGLIRVRLGLLAAAFVVLGAAAGGIFDTNEWALILTPTVPCAVVALLARRSPWLRTLGAIAAVFAATAICVFSAGGNVDDVGVAVTSGTRRLLSTEWPSPDTRGSRGNRRHRSGGDGGTRARCSRRGDVGTSCRCFRSSSPTSASSRSLLRSAFDQSSSCCCAPSRFPSPRCASTAACVNAGCSCAENDA